MHVVGLLLLQVVATLLHKLELKAGLQYRGLEDDFIHDLEVWRMEGSSTLKMSAGVG